MDPNNLQNTMNGAGGNGQQQQQSGAHFNGVQPNPGGFGHQMALPGSAGSTAAGQYNPMLLQQQYLNFGFPMGYNNPMFDFQQQQQYQMQLQHQMQRQQPQHQQHTSHQQQQQQHMFNQQQMLQHMMQQQQVQRSQQQKLQQPVSQHLAPTSHQFQQVQQAQHQQQTQQPSQAAMFESSTHQKLYEAQRRQIEQQQKEQEELRRKQEEIRRKQEQEEAKKRAEEAKKQRILEEKRLAEEMQRRREQAERERIEEIKRQEEAARLEEERRKAEEKARFERERMQRFAEEQAKRDEEAAKQRSGMEERFRQVVAQPFTLVGTHFVTNFLDMIPFPYESMTDSQLPHVFDMKREGAILDSKDPMMIAAISKALNDTEVDDIITRMDKLRPEDKENNDLFMDKLPQMIRAVVEHSTSALDVDSHNDLELLENEDVMMTEDITRASVSEPNTSGYHYHSISMNTPTTSHMHNSMNHVEISGSAAGPSTDVEVEAAPISIEKRRQMMSVGKAPKAGGGGKPQRKKQRDIENLQDSLTENWIPTDTGRRGRRRGRASEDDDEMLQRDLKLIKAMEDGVKLPPSVTGFTADDEAVSQFFETRKRKKKDDKAVRRDRSPTPEDVIESRDAEWQERLRLKQERESARKVDEEHQNAWSLQALAENETYNRFCQTVDGVLEQGEGLDAELTSPKKKKRRSDVQTRGDDTYDESEEEEELDEIDPDLRIELPVLEELRRGSTRLRENSVLQALGVDRLTKLVILLDRNIRDAISADNTRLLVPCNDEVDAGDIFEKEICEERVKRATDAAVVVLNIMSSHKMFKQVIIEDVIDRCIGLTRLLLIHLIYPASDSVYKMVNTKKKAADDSKRRKKIGVCTRDRFTEYVYERITEVVGLLAFIAKTDSMTDTSVHNIASVAVTPFFVANVGALQVSAMLLASNVFSRAEDALRFSMITDVLASLHRAPQYTQKNTNNGYTLPDGSWISMTTALFIQLVQSTIKVPKHKKNMDEEEAAKRSKKDEAVVKESFLQASKVTNAFLNGFLAKCSQKGNKMDGEEDYRVLFSNFLQELLSALNSPEWPAAETILTALGSLLVKNFRAKSTEMTIRQASLEYLGSITAKLRKDHGDVDSKERLDAVVKKAFYLMDDKGYEDYADIDISELTGNDKLKILESSLIDYLVISNPSDIIVYACTFYVGEWYKEVVEDIEVARDQHKAVTQNTEATEKDLRKSEKKYERLRRRGAEMKEFLSKMMEKKEIKRRLEKSNKVKIMDSDVIWAVKHLAAHRELAHSFETYLKHIVFGAGSETIVALRTKALKCLSSIIESDSDVLVMDDVRQAVHSRMVDSHAQVREAAVELIGRFVLYDENYVRMYYPQIAERILDTGVAVRKRVIRIMREICERFPNFEMIPDMLARMIRRVTDEEGVKKLVYETFSTLWFHPVDPRVNPDGVATKVTTMCSVAQHCIKDSMNDYLEMLILHIVKNGSEASGISVAVKQIIDSLVDHILNLEMNKSKDSSNAELAHLKQQEDKYMAYLSTLTVFSKIRPNLLAGHVEVLLPYLTFTGAKTNTENQVTKEMIGMLERVIPLISYPSAEILNSIDENLSKVILYNGMAMVVSAVSCVASIYQKFRQGATQTIGIFGTYLKTVELTKRNLEINRSYNLDPKMFPILSRTIFTIGVLSRYLPFEKFVTGNNVTEKEIDEMKDRVFVALEFFSRDHRAPLRQKALTALGHFCAEHSSYLTKKQLTTTYLQILNSPQAMQQRVLVLQNLEMFLQCEEHKLAASHDKWEENKDAQNLKEMELSGSGLGSSVIQKYWKAVLESYVDPDVQLRRASAQVVWLTLNQGLVTPGASIPTLIAMITDPVETIRNRIDILLKEIDSKYSGMVQSKAMQGVRLAYKLHQKLHLHAKTHKYVRGFRFCDFHLNTKPEALPEKTHDGMAVLSGLYQSLRTNRQTRRSFIQMVVKLFSDGDFREGKPQLMEYIFIADNLAMFPYQMVDEVLFVIRVIDQNIAQSGQSLLVQYKNQLNVRDDEDEDVVFVDYNLFAKLSQLNRTETFQNLFVESQIPSLLLYVRTFLMQLYGFNETKVAEYSPSEPVKVYERAVTRRNIAMFKPVSALEALHLHYEFGSQQHITFLADKICSFRKMLLSLDQTENVDIGDTVITANQGDDYDDEEEDDGGGPSAGIPPEVDAMEH